MCCAPLEISVVVRDEMLVILPSSIKTRGCSIRSSGVKRALAVRASMFNGSVSIATAVRAGLVQINSWLAHLPQHLPQHSEQKLRITAGELESSHEATYVALVGFVFRVAR